MPAQTRISQTRMQRSHATCVCTALHVYVYTLHMVGNHVRVRLRCHVRTLYVICSSQHVHVYCVQGKKGDL